jgi:DNA-binding CsgD family transcriptional regulator
LRAQFSASPSRDGKLQQPEIAAHVEPMTYLATVANMQEAVSPVTSRSALARLMRRICIDIRADHYMLVEPSSDRGPKSLRIIASNWVFDALEDLGDDGVARIVQSGWATSAGMRPNVLVPSAAPFLSQQDKQALREHGHAEVYCQKLEPGGGSVFALFSAFSQRRIDPTVLTRAHMACCYGLAQFFAACGGRSSPDPLSERERECLLWVSEGKTTDEVALILGVSSNTVNSYIAHAIQKLGASNRAMAIATAIRNGII